MMFTLNMPGVTPDEICIFRCGPDAIVNFAFVADTPALRNEGAHAFMLHLAFVLPHGVTATLLTGSQGQLENPHIFAAYIQDDGERGFSEILRRAVTDFGFTIMWE